MNWIIDNILCETNFKKNIESFNSSLKLSELKILLQEGNKHSNWFTILIEDWKSGTCGRRMGLIKLMGICQVTQGWVVCILLSSSLNFS